MMALALNLLALLIVLGMCWGAMMWLSGRFHGHPQGAELREAEFERTYYDAAARSDTPLSSDTPASADAPCTSCEGVGAHSRQGKLAPCPECYGTGVLS